MPMKHIPLFAALLLASIGATANMPWPPAVERDGYLASAPGYVRFSEGPLVDVAVGGCPERNTPSTRVRIAFGPAGADGWVEHIDLLACGTDKRLMRIKAPNAQLAPYTDAAGLLRSQGNAVKETFRETQAGIAVTLRGGEVMLLNGQLKEIRFEPERTLFGSRDVMHLLDEPGLFLPYLKPNTRYQPPQGMLGFRQLLPEAGAFNQPAEFFRRRAEVWDTAEGRRFGVCGRTIDAIDEWTAQPPACGPRYRQVESLVLSWDTDLVRRATNLVILGELEDGRWEIAHAERNPAIQRANYAERMGRPADLPTEAEAAKLQPQARDALLASLGEVYAARMRAQEQDTAAFRRLQAADKEAAQRWSVELAAQQRQALLADLERRRQEAQARRDAAAAAIAAGEPRCWTTADCGLSWRQRYEMAIKADDREAAHRIAMSAYGVDRSLAIDDIRRDWAHVAPGRGPRFWTEQKVHALAVRDAVVRQGIGAETWKHAERWAAMRDHNEARRNAETFWSQLAAMGPVSLRSLDGARPLSSLEQDYYVGRGYVVVRRERPGSRPGF